MEKPAVTIQLSSAEHATLTAWVRAPSTSQGVALRSRIILLADTGMSNTRIAGELGVSRPTVLLWRQRYAAGGPEALTHIEPGRGRKRTISAERVKEIVEATLHTVPPGATHWSCRTMARAQGVSAATIQRIWDAHGLQPHRVETFKLSTDPRFVEKLTDVVGLYQNPPEHAIVLCIDEKSQIQALDRTRPGLPMKQGRAGTMTYDYKRNGTTTLFGALNVLEGTMVEQCLPRHRHQEFLTFLRKVDGAFPRELDLHIVLDNYATHKHPVVREWLEGHPRFKLHFTPTGASWLNLIERWFRELTEKRLRRGVFPSVAALIEAILDYVRTTNEHPRPFVWHASIEEILRKVNKCKAILETVH